MIDYRPFRNTDLRPLVEVWRSHAPCRGLVQPCSVALLEEYVLAKPYFDRHGLIVAIEEGRPIGFVHAGFNGDSQGRTLDHASGVVALLMTLPVADRLAVEAGLIDRAEAYLAARGAKRISLGSAGRKAPFFLGLYGGGGSPGVLESDEPLAALARRLVDERGYTSMRPRIVWTRELATLRPVVDRVQMQIRRRANVELIRDPPSASWWEACAYGPIERMRFDLNGRDAASRWAWAEFWSMDAFSATWGVRSAALARIEVDVAQRREGLATFLLGEALKTLHQQGVALVETHTDAGDETSAALFRKMGFVEVDRGFTVEKSPT